MTRIVSALLLAAGIIIVALAGQSDAQDPPRKAVPVKVTAKAGFVVVGGYVEAGDQTGAISGARVRAFNIERLEVAATDTKADGTYELAIPRSALIGRQAAVGFISYEHPLWHSESVEILSSERETMEINKLLPIATGPADYVEIIHQIQVYEFFMSTSQAAPSPLVTFDTVEGYRKRINGIPHPYDRSRSDPLFVAAMSKMNDPGGAMRREVARRLNQLRMTYGMAPLADPDAPVPPAPQMNRGRCCLFCCW